ncbi:hypothetical protein SERLA73DRAFT_190231 [Serpula lacrymans var. lacrymans S7.3]|uniref:Membrane anchor Opy2 N-terminal domain-containing protein n=2 Tax=Serpula lacrymans var. lacrymans TaxID=341189 RepID=F8QFA7_SERL3|nr:uncharacterized protein SERLADRAFT_462125 [Serpula lacrymans var. lacrymans S7.9]EGN93066.1 hypothetical protein SERLA73DRAFT_190231 [Serpula lacrymans var. lacrymans S7.3]EGO27901.1 hypothetical protein SERLADRAFT_462125 [Serpula lacrymans var. lacrymans S7.9]
MHLDLVSRQSSGCLPCNDPPPGCNCAANENCVQTARSCNACPTTQCVPIADSSTGGPSSGVSTGALVGAVIAALVVVGGAIAIYIWYRRRSRARKAAAAAREAELTAPASAEAVLNRPDPTEKPSRPPTELSTVRVYSPSSNSVIDLDPESRGPSASGTAPLDSAARQSQCNPFGDDQSIQTTSTGTQSTNVIPIAFVPPGSVASRSPSAGSVPSQPGPVRPNRAPDLTLNYDQVNVSADSMRRNSPSYPRSTISGISGVSSRNSYMSGASYSSDFLNEAPMIVTQNQGAVRQVLGVVKAEMIHTSGSSSGSSPSSPMSMDSLKPPSVASRPSIRSPLAATSFGPADVVNETEEEHMHSVDGDPFSDDQSSRDIRRLSPSPSAATFGNRDSDWIAEGPARPWANKDDSSRPSSISTQAGSIVDIGSATRVNVGLLSSQSSQKSPYRTTMGRLVSPTSTLEPQTLEEQQQRALAHAQAQARAQSFSKANKRISGSSAISAASTHADSILESFPFVPPSPISSRPIRSPPRSPLHQQFSNVPSSSKETTETTSEPPKSPIAPAAAIPRPPPPPSPLDPPNRRVLGLSTVSQSSTASSGLGSFPFQIDSGNTEGSSSAPPSAFPPSTYQGRQRASLDTLALMSDLSTYPLGFDRDMTDSFTEFAKSSAYVSPSDRPL